MRQRFSSGMLSRPGLATPDWQNHSPFPTGLLMPPHAGEPLLLFTLAFMVFTGAFVVVDVAYSLTSVAAIGLFALLGLRFDRRNAPLLLFLTVFNLAGLVALQPHLDFAESQEFMIGTCFVAITAVFFCMVVNQNAMQRLEWLKWGLIIGALAAASAGIIGYIGILGLGGAFTMHEGRVSGTFRDPNVLGSFLVLPALFLMHDFLHISRWRLLRAALLGPILLALFLTYSRGSWAAMVIGTMVMIGLTFVTTRHDAMRARLTLLVLGGFFALAVAFAVILSIDHIAEVFADRFTLQKDYDSGPSGRFGNQIRSLPDLLTRPFGHGPNRFWLYYPENPHNTYLMAFSSYGWLGGLTFLGFIASTLYIGWRTALLRTPFQPYAIVIFAGLVPHLVQNFQIDTDRWRHLFMIYGLTWGLAAISRRWLDEFRFYTHWAYQSAAARVRPGAAGPPGGRAQPAE